MRFEKSFDVTIVGGGMITEMQILPSLYHLQRLDAVKKLQIEHKAETECIWHLS